MCYFCPKRDAIDGLLKAGKCDEAMRQNIKTKTLNSLKFDQILKDVDKQFHQWREKPIVIPTYNPLGKKSRLDWSEDIVTKKIEDGRSELEKEKKLSSKDVRRVLNKTFSEEMGFLRNVKGKRAELLVQEYLVKNELCNRPGLLVQGVNSFQHLFPFIKAFNVDVKEDVETDIVMVQPISSKRLRITLGEVKAIPEEASPEIKLERMDSALSQIRKDLQTFSEIFAFLRTEDWNNIKMKAMCFFPNMNFPDSINICKLCRDLMMFREDFSKSCRPTVETTTKNLCDNSLPVVELYIKVVGLYLGSGNSMPNKKSNDGYRRERRDLDHVSSLMSPEFLMNTDIYHPRTKGQILTGPFGSGKSLTLTFLIRKWLDHTRDSSLKNFFMVIIYKSDSEDLVNYYKGILPQGFKVFDKPKLFRILKINRYSFKSTTDELNKVFQILSNSFTSYDRHFIFIDEVKIRLGRRHLLGNAPFLMRNGVIAEWSNLRLGDSINAFISVSPESQCYLGASQYEEKRVLASNSRRHISTVFLQKVFRSNIQINKLVKHLNSDVGFNMSPNDAIMGHEISGEKPLWFPRRSKQHIWCTEPECSDCFCDREIFAKISRIDEKLGVQKEDITVIFQEIGGKMDSHSRARLREIIEMPHVKFNREYEVCI